MYHVEIVILYGSQYNHSPSQTYRFGRDGHSQSIFMIQLLTTTMLIMSYALSPPISLLDDYKQSNKILEPKPMVLKQYNSPTLNYDPWKEYQEKKNQEILDQIFIKELMEQTGI